MKRLSCCSCGSTLNTESLNPEFAVIHCSHCGSLYDASTLERNTYATDSNSEIEARYPRPENIRVNRGSNQVGFSWRAHHPVTSLGSLLINFLVFGHLSQTLLPKYLDGFSWHNGNPAEFGIVNWLLIAGSVWISSVLLLNRHRIRLTNSSLVVDQTPVPIPWKLRKTVPRNKIHQCFVAERVQHKKNQSPHTYYVLRLIDTDDTLIDLPGRFKTPEQALYIERNLESELNLANIRIAGEISRE